MSCGDGGTLPACAWSSLLQGLAKIKSDVSASEALCCWRSCRRKMPDTLLGATSSSKLSSMSTGRVGGREVVAAIEEKKGRS